MLLSLQQHFSALFLLLVLILLSDDVGCGDVELTVGDYRALTGELEVGIRGPAGRLVEARLQLLERGVQGGPWITIYTIPLPERFSAPPQALASLKMSFPCGYVSRGGRYAVLLNTSSPHSIQEDDIVEMDVRWPKVTLSLSPKLVQTYPEKEVVATVTFIPESCQPVIGSMEPETWLNLIYCGHSPIECVSPNATHTQVLYEEQIRGYPNLRHVKLGCQLFGLAGYYALVLRTDRNQSSLVIGSTQPETTLKAVWSDKFVFNVYAHSVFPCEGDGVQVVFEYPGCILSSGDRVRLFARLRPDVAALAPPTSLHYVAEQKVDRGRHKLFFDCSLFSERFVEYCFVYVSQAVTGALSDVRMDCVPTLSVLESESGGWGSWSEWSSCSSTCSFGTRNRYRFCDSPPPRYGAKFCQGQALETERCGLAAGSWECRFYQDQGNGDLPAERPEVQKEVGMGCRCGCVLHIGRAKRHRLVAASAHACPGRTFWLIKSEEGSRIRVSVEQLWLPCTGQALKVRDGDSSRAELLAVLEGDPQEAPVVTSTSNTLLVEFTAGEPLAHGLDCNGGFLAHVLCVTGQGASNVTPPSVERVLVGPTDRDVILWPGGGYVNAGVALLLLLAVVATGCLCLQYVYRYRKYQLAAAHEELDSITENSLIGGSLGIVRSRATSSSSLISEVISLKKFHVHRANKHCRLAEEEEEDLDMEEYKKIERDATSLTTLKVEDNEEGLNQLSVDKPHIRKAVIVQADVETRPNSLDVERTKRIHQVKLIQKPRFKSPVSPASLSVEEVNITPTNSPRVKRCRASTSSSQSSTLTNGSSPASSRSTTLKETKEKRNRERMMAGSEFSLAEDLEIDYYDYDVENAEPGSYLSMDPAFCLWIPPFAPGLWPEDQVKSPIQGTAKSPCVESGKRNFTPSEKETSVEKSPSDYYDLQAELRFADEDEPEETLDLKSKKDQTSKQESCVVVTDIPSKKIYYLPNRRNSSNNSSVIMSDE